MLVHLCLEEEFKQEWISCNFDISSGIVILVNISKDSVPRSPVSWSCDSETTAIRRSRFLLRDVGYIAMGDT